MSDFDTIKNILDRVDPQDEVRPYYDYVQDNKIMLVFPQSDDWYDTVFVFDENGKLISIN